MKKKPSNIKEETVINSNNISKTIKTAFNRLFLETDGRDDKDYIQMLSITQTRGKNNEQNTKRVSL